MHQALRSGDPEAMILCCSGPEMPGRGPFVLLYTNNDTGHTGHMSWKEMGEIYTSLAAHLFKHRRWGVLQPSCLVVGLPGVLEEARMRATLHFMCGGQVDIGDELTTLPEDRWEVLYATLPPQGRAAKPVDLFEPVPVVTMSQEAMRRRNNASQAPLPIRQASSVWSLDMEADWDRWTLVSLVDYEGPAGADGGVTIFRLALERVGLDPNGTYWAHEFWSGQFLGEVPSLHPLIKTPACPEGYVHPGDHKCLIDTQFPGVLDIAFVGPGVKLLVLRAKRDHPWVAATSFYQGGGTELQAVRWDPAKRELSGKVTRPPGHLGKIYICGAPGLPTLVEVAGRRVTARAGANQSVIVPVVTEAEVTPVRLRW